MKTAATMTTAATATLNTNINHAQTNNTLANIADLAGRFGLAAIFLLAGMNKVQYFDGNAQYLASGGLPEFLLPVVIAFEILGALALIAGFKIRLVALAFAGFTVLSAAIFHNNLADQMQFFMFFKNIAMAGGFLIIAAHGAGKYSLETRNQNQ